MSRPKDPRVGRMPIWQKVVLWVIGTGTVLVLGFAALLVVGLSGGWDDVLDLSKPAADDARVQDAEREHRAANQEALAQVVVVARDSGVVGATLGAAEQSGCREGQHNWKIDDDFDLWCSLSDASLVVGGSVAQFEADMRVLHADLTAAGWAGGYGDLEWVLTNHWSSMGQEERVLNNYPAGLPGAQYARGDERLVIQWYLPDILAGSVPDWLEWTDGSGRSVSAESLVDGIPDGRYGATFTLERDYFRD